VSVAETETPTETETPPVTEPDAPPETEPPIEPEPPAESEPQDEPPAAPAVDHVAMERILEKIDRSATTYRNRVSDLLGEQAQDLSPCPLCEPGIMGLIYPPEWTEPVSELHARLLDVLKTPSAPEYRDAPNVRQCGTCAGWGSVLSGSRVAGKERVLCPTCKGNGFQGDQAVTPAPQGTNGSVDPEWPADTAPLVSGDADIWGSPKVLDDGQDNPNYGKMPQYKNPALP
jgi:hypothetical protein